MTATNQNFSMIAGDSKRIVITLGENMTGATAKWVLKKRITSLENEVAKTTDNGISITGTEITIKLEPSDTLNLAGTCYHECEITDSQGNVSTITKGYATIEKSAV